MIFQDALSSLNPVFPVGWQIAEMFRKHRGMNKSDALAQAIRLMERVQIPAARERVRAYPHQFSGGMRQRIMIAMAIALDPAVLIADEPTTALDVTVQAQIMSLLQELQEERQMGLILITHDLGVVADVADRIAVMYAGRLVETADVYDAYAAAGPPVHQGPASSRSRGWTRRGRPCGRSRGLPPNLMRIPPGCAFNPRCYLAQDVCRRDRPGAARGRPRTGTRHATSPRRCSMADVILTAEDLVKHYPIRKRCPAHRPGPGQGCRRGRASTCTGRDARHRRRVRLWQVHARPVAHAAREADERPGHVRGRGHEQHLGAASCVASVGTSRSSSRTPTPRSTPG